MFDLDFRRIGELQAETYNIAIGVHKKNCSFSRCCGDCVDKIKCDKHPVCNGGNCIMPDNITQYRFDEQSEFNRDWYHSSDWFHNAGYRGIRVSRFQKKYIKELKEVLPEIASFDVRITNQLVWKLDENLKPSGATIFQDIRTRDLERKIVGDNTTMRYALITRVLKENKVLMQIYHKLPFIDSKGNFLNNYTRIKDRTNNISIFHNYDEDLIKNWIAVLCIRRSGIDCNNDVLRLIFEVDISIKFKRLYPFESDDSYEKFKLICQSYM